MGTSRRNGARPRLTLEILWTNSRVRRILGGPGRNRPGPRMLNPFMPPISSHDKFKIAKLLNARFKFIAWL